MAHSAATHPLTDLPSSSDAQCSRPVEPLYGGFTRFELELEFVQSLANPYYLNHLASQKLLQDPSFVAYLKYLQYFTQPKYIVYLTYPGPTLKALELLQHEQFRREILSPETVARLAEATFLSSTKPK
ncbi:MAG: hypothetical protein Q9208_004937 [Pyrenodesmia sp. 3 TL-2023]